MKKKLRMLVYHTSARKWSENIHCNNRNRHTRSLQSTRRMETRQGSESIRPRSLIARLSLTKWRVHIAGAAASAVLIHNSNVDEAAYETHVQHNSDEGRERQAGDTAQQQQPDEGVQHRRARYTCHSADGRVDGKVVVMQGGEEVGVYAEDECRTEELYASNEPL